MPGLTEQAGAQVNGDAKQKEQSEPSEDRYMYSKAVLRYDEYWDFRSYSWKLRKSAKPERKLKNKSAFLVSRRRIDEKGRYVDTEIDIKSDIILKALTEINEGVEGLKLRRSPATANAKLFFHSLSDLEHRVKLEEAKAEPSQDVITHLGCAIRFAQEEHAEDLQSFANYKAAQEMTWDLLWALFKPNTTIYLFHDLTEQNQLMIVKGVRSLRRNNGMPYWSISCDYIADDGSSFGYARATIEIDHFEGARKIQDLEAYPFDFYPNQDEIMAHAIKRGRRVANLVGHTYLEVNGAAMREVRTSDYQARFLKFHSFGRVILDAKSFRTFEPNAAYNRTVQRRLDRGNLTDEQLAICSPIVLGFCFGAKMWGGFAIDRCSEVYWSDEAFPSLVLSKARKDLLHSLVKQHDKKKDSFDDVIQGKGKGLIGLLSGKPGCGKTLTAEAISELTRRPLYTVSAGELGTEPGPLDERLTMILELSLTWNAILLLDEADVFLQARSDLDLKRNALVSIFLRQLEYYQGILLLTTNRIGNCDPAFESRIHFSFHYDDLDFNSRKQIWRTFWNRAGDPVTALDDESLDILAKHQLNGRQIKNTVGSAMSIALEEGVPLARTHADTVLEVVQGWDAVVRS